MSASHFEAFIQHAYWGLDKILAALEQAPDRLDEHVSEGAQTPRNTLRHMFAFERGFLGRLHGESTSFSDPAPEDLEELRTAWAPIRQGWLEYIANIPDEVLDEPFEVQLGAERYRVTRAQILSQFVQHQGQHRSELAVMASTFGHSPDEFDWWDYLVETGQPPQQV